MNTNHIELFIHPDATEATNAWLQIGLKLLDWPFLLSVILFFFIVFFREQLRTLLNRKEILLKWGERSIQLRDLEDTIAQEIDPLRDEVEELKKTPPDSIPKKTTGAQFVNSEEPPIDALKRMKDALKLPEYKWRTLSRLAAIACISELEAKVLLHSDPEVVFSIGKSGHSIAKLKSR